MNQSEAEQQAQELAKVFKFSMCIVSRKYTFGSKEYREWYDAIDKEHCDWYYLVNKQYDRFRHRLFYRGYVKRYIVDKKGVVRQVKPTKSRQKEVDY